MEKLSSPIDLIKKSFSIFFQKQNLVYFLKIYAVLVPFTIFFALQGKLINFDVSDMTKAGALEGLSKSWGVLGLTVVVGLLYSIISFWISAAGIKAVAITLSGSSLGAWETLKLSWKKLWGFFLVNFLSGLISIGGLIIISALWGILAIAFPISTTITMVNSLNIALTVVKAILVIGGLVSFVFVFIFVIWFTFSRFIYIDLESGVRASLRTSRELIRGKFWAVTGRLFIFGLFTSLLGFIVSVIPYGMGGVVTALFGALFILPYFLLYKELSGSGGPTV